MKDDQYSKAIRKVLHNAKNTDFYRACVKRKLRVPSGYTAWDRVANELAAIRTDLDVIELETALELGTNQLGKRIKKRIVRLCDKVLPCTPVYALDGQILDAFTRSNPPTEISNFKALHSVPFIVLLPASMSDNHLAVSGFRPRYLAMETWSFEERVEGDSYFNQGFSWFAVFDKLLLPRFDCNEDFSATPNYYFERHSEACVQDYLMEYEFDTAERDLEEVRPSARDIEGFVRESIGKDFWVTWVDKIESLIFQIFAYLQTSQNTESLVAHNSQVKRRSAKDIGQGIQYPRWIGNNYKRKYDHRLNLGGTHSSPIAHWRQGHYRSQPCGLEGKERKTIWIEPTFING